MDLQKYKISYNPLGQLECCELLDYPDYPILSVERSDSGQKYLSYLVTYLPDGLEQRILIPINNHILQKIKAGELHIRKAFSNPNLEHVFATHLDPKEGEVKEFFIIPLAEFNKFNPIDHEYKIFVPGATEACEETKK